MTSNDWILCKPRCMLYELKARDAEAKAISDQHEELKKNRSDQAEAR